MKKRMIFLAVLTLVIAVALPAAAETKFAWSGEITSYFQTDFATAKEAVSTATLTLGVTINDIVGFGGLVVTTAVPGYGVTNGNGAYYATLDVGNLLKMDAKVFDEGLKIGNFDPGPTTYAVSAAGLEGVFGSDLTAGAVTIASTTTINNMINVYVALDPASIAAVPAYLFNVYGTFGPVSASLGYGSNTIVGADVKFAPVLGGDVGFAIDTQFGYNTGASTYKVGFGGKVTYKTLLTVSASSTYATAGLGPLGFDISLDPADTYGADLAVRINTSGAPFSTTAGKVDASFWTKIDVAKLTLGYVYTQAGGGPGALPNGGLYATFDVSF